MEPHLDSHEWEWTWMGMDIPIMWTQNPMNGLKNTNAGFSESHFKYVGYW